MAAELGPRAMFVAGGTDLFPKLKRRQFEVEALISLAFLERQVRGGSGETVVDAGLTLAEAAADAHLNQEFKGYAEAAGLVSSPPLRNAGTIGGNLCVDTRCNYYDMTYEWRKAVGFCLKKDGVICLVAPSSPRCAAWWYRLATSIASHCSNSRSVNAAVFSDCRALRPFGDDPVAPGRPRTLSIKVRFRRSICPPKWGRPTGRYIRSMPLFPATAAKGPAFELGGIVEMQDLWNAAHRPIRVHLDLREHGAFHSAALVRSKPTVAAPGRSMLT